MTGPESLPESEPLSELDPSELAGLTQRLQAALEAAFVSDESAVEQSGERCDDSEDRADPEPGVVESAGRGPSSNPFFETDRRLYLPLSDDWQVRVHKGIRAYCSYQNPNESWFHLIVDGELYLQSGDEKICLNCALRHGVLTTDRLHWQKGWRRGLNKTSTNKTSGDKAG